jgi:hypothetical protein
MFDFHIAGDSPKARSRFQQKNCIGGARPFPAFQTVLDWWTNSVLHSPHVKPGRKLVECGAPLVAECFVREGDELTEVRYPKCPACEHRCETACKPGREDIETLAALEKKRIREWHPKNRLFYDDGTPFMKKEHYDSLDQLFTRRNLQAAAWLHEAIQKESSPFRTTTAWEKPRRKVSPTTPRHGYHASTLTHIFAKNSPCTVTR